VTPAVIPILRTLRQEDLDFKTSLGKKEKLCGREGREGEKREP
jgi:hypothetical protein